MSVETLSPLPVSHTVWRFPFSLAALAVGIGMLTLLPFWDGLTYMWNAWLIAPEYSHSFLIPPISAFLVWQQRDRLRLMTFEGSWWGVALIAASTALLVLGQLGTVYVLVQYAYVLTLFGLALALAGRKAFLAIAFPLVILLLMVPLPYFLLSNLSSKLQLISSQLGVWFIRLFGISVFVEGNVIDLGGYKLQVAEACNGLRYLFPLMTLGFLIGYFYKGALWKRIALFLSSLPITILMNSFRVGTIGVMVEHWGIQMAEGFLHEFQGWLLFMVSAALMIGEVAILNRIGHERGTWQQLFGLELPALSRNNNLVLKQRTFPPAFIGACVLLTAVAAAATLLPRPAEIFPMRETFDEFPSELGDRIAHRGTLEGIYLDTLKLDDYLIADYTDGHSPAVNLYVAYYKSQRKGEAIHSPRSCLPGGGWQLSDFDQRTLPEVKIDGRALRVNRSLIALGNERQLVYYWFEQRGRLLTNEFAVKWYLFWDAVTRHRTDGALVRVMTAIPAGGNEADADRRLIDLTKHLAPLLPNYVPN